MTPAQHARYFREWSTARRAIESAIGSRLSAIASDQCRRELNVHACGKESSKAFNKTTDLDAFIAACQAIYDPANLNAQLEKQSQPRKRLLWFIQNCNPDYVAALLHERFAHASDPADLNEQELRHLHMTLKNRSAAFTPLQRTQTTGIPSAISEHELVTAEPF